MPQGHAGSGDGEAATERRNVHDVASQLTLAVAAPYAETKEL